MIDLRHELSLHKHFQHFDQLAYVRPCYVFLQDARAFPFNPAPCIAIVAHMRQDHRQGQWPLWRAWYLDTRVANDGVSFCDDPLIIDPRSIVPKVRETRPPQQWLGDWIDQVHKFAEPYLAPWIKHRNHEHHAATHSYSVPAFQPPTTVPIFGYCQWAF
jgi:hypothetical protein